MQSDLLLLLLRLELAVIGLYFLARNKIDFLLLFFCSFCLYHWQILWGTIWVPPFTFDVSTNSMFIVGLIAIVIFGFVLLNDRLWRHYPDIPYVKSNDFDQFGVILVLLTVGILACLYSLYVAGDKIMLNKNEFTRAQGLKYDILYYYPAAMALLYGILTKNKLITFLSLLPLTLYLLVGYRAIIVTAIIGAVFISMYGERIFTFKMIKVLILVLTLFIFFVFYKFSYIAIKANSFDWFAHIIEGDDRFDSVFQFFIWGMFSAEFGQVSSNLSLSSSQDLSSHYNFSDAVLGSITGLNTILNYNEDITRFSRVIREFANPGFSYGLGGSFWGEMYQAGSYVGVFAGALIVVGFITYFNLNFKMQKERFSLFLFLFSFLAFYIHRNDFTLLIGHVKNHLFLITFAYGVLLLINGRVKIPSFRKQRVIF